MYDAIIVGARCAGSPTAMLLARQGFKVLLVDRATFPSDTISTHILWPHGAEILARWGLLSHAGSDRCAADLPAHDVRCRPVRSSRRHSRRERWHGRVLSASDRARQPLGECRGRGRRRGSGGLHRRRVAGDRRYRHGRSRPWKRRKASRGARPDGDRRRRRELLRRTSGASCGVRRSRRWPPAATTGTSAASDKTISSCTCGTTTPSVARRPTMVSIS